MIRFEIKKIFSKSMNKMALIVLTAALVIVCILTINNIEYIEYINGQKKVSTGIAGGNHATASRYNIPVIQVIINNHVLGMVRQWQTLFYGKRYSQTVLNDKVDFCKVAEGLGCTAIRVTKKEEVEPAVRKAIDLKAPVVIECVIPEDDKVFPMVPAGAPIAEVFDGDDLKE